MKPRLSPRPILLACIVTLIAAGSFPAHSQSATSPRSTERFDSGWRFHYRDAPGSESPAYGDAAWRSVDLPHDQFTGGSPQHDDV